MTKLSAAYTLERLLAKVLREGKRDARKVPRSTVAQRRRMEAALLAAKRGGK